MNQQTHKSSESNRYSSEEDYCKRNVKSWTATRHPKGPGIQVWRYEDMKICEEMEEGY
jgi:hypothetical protein